MISKKFGFIQGRMTMPRSKKILQLFKKISIKYPNFRYLIELIIENIKYPYNSSMIYFARNGAIILHKKLSSQSGVGFAYFHMEDNYLGDYSDLGDGTIYENTFRYNLHKKIDIFAPVGYYYLFSKPKQLFNPVFYFSLGFYNVRIVQSINNEFEVCCGTGGDITDFHVHSLANMFEWQDE